MTHSSLPERQGHKKHIPGLSRQCLVSTKADIWTKQFIFANILNRVFRLVLTRANLEILTIRSLLTNRDF